MATQTVSQAIKDLPLRPGSISTLTRNNRSISVPNPECMATADDPLFLALVIDRSGSMKGIKDVVISTMNDCMNAVRGSKACRMKRLNVGIYTFADAVSQHCEFGAVSSDGKDHVAPFGDNNYVADGKTALYRAVNHVLQDMAATIKSAQTLSLKPLFGLVVVTDGDDTEGGFTPSDIATVLADLNSNGYVYSSCLIGITGDKLASTRVTELRDAMGFQTCLMPGATEKEIRAAFRTGSLSNLN